MSVSENLDAIELTGIRRFFEAASRFPDAINLGIGEPDLDPPLELIEAAARHMRQGRNKYGPIAGIRELREELARIYSKRSRSVGPENVFVTIGGENALFASMAAILKRGDEVVVISPSFPSYAAIARIFGAEVVFLRPSPERGFVPDEEELRSSVSDRTKAVIVNSPSNPTGAVYGSQDMRKVVDVAAEVGAYVISDEVYEPFVYDGQFSSAADLMDGYGSIVVVQSFSKSLSITGWRIGYLIAPDDLAERMQKFLLYSHACPPTFAQHAVLDALRSGVYDDYVRSVRELYRKRRDLVVGLMRETGMELVAPKGAFYAFPRLPGIDDDMSFCARLLEEKRVVVVPGSSFGPGGEGHVRVSFAASEEKLVEGITRMGQLLREMGVT
ncbi:MAG: pyridoxal phosphate-dependent aminotransferase [Nitrososphaerota archaeon]